MISFIQRLRNLNPSGNLSYQGNLSLLLTGLSSLSSAHLNPEQTHFLQAVMPKNVNILYSNFPYHDDFLKKPYHSPNLLIASLRNIFQFILATFSPDFGRIIAARLKPLLQQQRKLVIITGSCGLALFNAALPYLKIEDMEKVMIIALGPVSFRTKDNPCKLYRIRGTRDWVSKMSKAGMIHYTVNCGHLDYYINPETQKIVRDLCEQHFS